MLFWRPFSKLRLQHTDPGCTYALQQLDGQGTRIEDSTTKLTQAGPLTYGAHRGFSPGVYAIFEQEYQGIVSNLEGVKHFTLATVARVITTIIAFNSMLFIQSGMGRLFSVMASMVIFCLIRSLIATIISSTSPFKT